MSNVQYPAPVGDYVEDDGTMPQNVADLADAIIGHKIVKVEQSVPESDDYYASNNGATLTLDNGKRVVLRDNGDCCAYTELKKIIEHLPTTDHIITAVRPNGDYTEWAIVADLGDVLSLTVGWSAGNAFYYGYGFAITVEDTSITDQTYAVGGVVEAPDAMTPEEQLLHDIFSAPAESEGTP